MHVGFRTGSDDVVEWTFARQLLTDGVTRAVGEGDVQVWPLARRRRAGRVPLAVLPVGPRPVRGAARPSSSSSSRTPTRPSPTGGESDFVDLDAELALLLWSGAGE